jgi:hypothetical protein
MTDTRTNGHAGICPVCDRETGNLTRHVPSCRRRNGLTLATPEDGPHQIRAAAHTTVFLDRVAQKWQHGVTDESVAVIMYLIEAGMRFRLNRMGRWVTPADHPVSGFRGTLGGRDASVVIHEMIRTGLLRHVIERRPDGSVDHLVPALVHLRDGDWWSACRFTGEDLGSMRSRLVTDLALVDCLECCQTVARGHTRGL